MRAIILNGGSSSGKSSIARSLQERLNGMWLCFGIDDLVAAMPKRDFQTLSGLTVSSSGQVNVGGRFRAYEQAWMGGLLTIAEGGISLILEDVFISGPAAQKRWKDSLLGVDIFWVGVTCSPDVAALRELARGDRCPGMARSQAEDVHVDVDYDFIVDTTSLSTESCADLIALKLERRWYREE